MADEEVDEKKDPDPRFDFILQYILKMNKVKMDIWHKLKETNEYRNVIQNFFDTPTENLLLVELSPASVLIPHSTIQFNFKTKYHYFLRNEAVKITGENVSSVIVFGEMTPRSFDDLATMIEEVFIPILANPAEYETWPDVIAEDVRMHIYELRSLICQIRSKLSGETMLPMPMGTERVFAPGPVSPSLRRNIEEVVIKWTELINQVLVEDSSQVLEQEEQPLPRLELAFWRKRLKNIESIYDQLRDPRVKKMAQILEKSKSKYLPSLQNIFKDVVGAVAEARDICLHLLPLEKYFQEIESQSDFPSIEPRLKPMMHCICLTWARSKYYCKSVRIVTLFKEINNMILIQAMDYLDSLFQGEAEDSLKKIARGVAVIENFQDLYEIFRGRVTSYFKHSRDPLGWTFHEKLIFDRLLKFLSRVKQIKSLLEVAQEYFRLEKIEIAGLRGRKLGALVLEIYEDFIKRYTEFSNVSYEMLLPEEDAFDKDHEIFLKQIEEYDRTLASIFDQAFSECHTIESMYKFTVNLGTIVSRPIIFRQLWPYYEKLLVKLHEELDTAKVIFDENVKLYEETGYMIVDGGFPPVAGELCFLKKLETRAQYPVEWVKSVEHPLMHSESMEVAVGKYEQLVELTKEKGQEIFAKWVERVPEWCEMGLAKTLLERSEDGRLAVNFDEDLAMVLRESRYLVTIVGKTDLPAEALDIFSRATFFADSNVKLGNICSWYNDVNARTSEIEKFLIAEELQAINELVDYGQENYTWDSPEVIEYVDKMYDMLGSLSRRIAKAQRNLSELRARLDAWASLPVITRKDNRRNQLLAMAERKETFEKRYQLVSADAEEVERVLDENYKLYFDLIPEVPEGVQAQEEQQPPAEEAGENGEKKK